MKRSPYWKVVTALLLLVVCSGFVGGVVALQFQKRQFWKKVATIPGSNNVVGRVSDQLNLTPEQRVQAHSILERGQAEIRAVSSNAVIGVMQARERMEAELRPLLSPEQLRRLERLSERREKARERLSRGERAWPAPKDHPGERGRNAGAPSPGEAK